jgi:quinol monooxygenase YgiN
MVKRIIQTKFAITLGLAAMLIVFSNLQSAGQAAKTNPKPATQTAMNENGNASGMPSLPFNVVVVRHNVADYSKWKPLFDSDSTNRKTAGMHALGVSRGIDNQNEVEIPFVIDDVTKAKTFTTSPKLKDVMQKAGVSGAPNIKFIKVMRLSDAMQSPGDYLEVSHKVKDFDAWLKVFDTEGSATRQQDGLTDGVLARGIDDPNLVYLVFKITDVAKAKAALENPARQKIMQEAGVVGKPEVYFGRDQQ